MDFGDLFGGRQEPAAGPGEIGLSDAMVALSEGGVVADIRSQADYERGHIPGALLVDLTELKASPIDAIWGDDPLAETEKKVVVVSVSPEHAHAIAHLMTEAGIDAEVLAGGLMAWIRDGQPLVPGPPRKRA